MKRTKTKGAWTQTMSRATTGLQCKRCQHSWAYRGLKRPTKLYSLYVSCPRCRTSVKLGPKLPGRTIRSAASLRDINIADE